MAQTYKLNWRKATWTSKLTPFWTLWAVLNRRKNCACALMRAYLRIRTIRPTAMRANAGILPSTYSSTVIGILPEFMHRFFAVTDISVTFRFYNTLVSNLINRMPHGTSKHKTISWHSRSISIQKHWKQVYRAVNYGYAVAQLLVIAKRCHFLIWVKPP